MTKSLFKLTLAAYFDVEVEAENAWEAFNEAVRKLSEEYDLEPHIFDLEDYVEISPENPKV